MRVYKIINNLNNIKYKIQEKIKKYIEICNNVRKNFIYIINIKLPMY